MEAIVIVFDFSSPLRDQLSRLSGLWLHTVVRMPAYLLSHRASRNKVALVRNKLDDLTGCC